MIVKKDKSFGYGIGKITFQNDFKSLIKRVVIKSWRKKSLFLGKIIKISSYQF